MVECLFALLLAAHIAIPAAIVYSAVRRRMVRQ